MASNFNPFVFSEDELKNDVINDAMTSSDCDDDDKMSELVQFFPCLPSPAETVEPTTSTAQQDLITATEIAATENFD